jgi:hypothetical protein
MCVFLSRVSPGLLTSWIATSGQWIRENPTIVIAGGAAAVGAALAPVLIPLLLHGVGFGGGGVVAGSWAAGVHASLGNVAAGGLFSLAQSVGAGGALPLVGYLAGAGLGLSVSFAAETVRFVLMKLLERGIKLVQNAFRKYILMMKEALRVMWANPRTIGTLAMLWQYLTSIKQSHE